MYDPHIENTLAYTYQVRLVAVSKLKPANDILALHQSPASHTHFGENYAQELIQKAALLPNTVQWHFIGGLQSGQTLDSYRYNRSWNTDILHQAIVRRWARSQTFSASQA